MTTAFELWDTVTRNLICDFDTLDAALEEVRWRVEIAGDEAGRECSLIEFHDDGESRVVAAGDNLLHQAQQIPVGD